MEDYAKKDDEIESKLMAKNERIQTLNCKVFSMEKEIESLKSQLEAAAETNRVVSYLLHEKEKELNKCAYKAIEKACEEAMKSQIVTDDSYHNFLQEGFRAAVGIISAYAETLKQPGTHKWTKDNSHLVMRDDEYGVGEVKGE